MLFAPVAIAGEKDAAPEFACLIQPKMVLKLGSQVQGLISEVLVDRGAIIKQGEVVARLESGVEQAELEIAKARAANDSTVQSDRAKVEFQKHKEERSRELRKTEAMSISTAEEAETAATVAEGDLREAEVNQGMAQLEVVRSDELLKLRTIRSPINGVSSSARLALANMSVPTKRTSSPSPRSTRSTSKSTCRSVSSGGFASACPARSIRRSAGVTSLMLPLWIRVYDAASATIGGFASNCPIPIMRFPPVSNVRFGFPASG